MMTKEERIAYEVAYKAAVELVKTNVVTLTTDDIGSELAELADMLNGPRMARLGGGGAAPTPVPAPAGNTYPPATATSPAPAAAPTGAFEVKPPWLLTDTACPDCAANARTGVLIQNTDPSWRGPEFKCALKQVQKRGNDFVDVGPCVYQDWGRNTR